MRHHSDRAKASWQSIVVWAIAEGREAARHIDEYLTGRPSHLRARDRSPLTVVPA